ncbi:MAG: translation initiation factor IF-3 [Ignavibacteria bacterium]|nr:translation initiation factor IF-3 [Ignavibacteria bacterium]MBK7445365.1 translation initiation factor IF-3 [Ignavibacteria bacterium]MBK8383055.1 translation initiation factor IF-3 [Ignavibacteria bacterium]MBK9403930.1 translation initiation factor IF-3 [Ignavibacteria bacterium]MBL0108885.1 translation initiation factor IF-3 [Ignavibacteria bacterium]
MKGKQQKERTNSQIRAPQVRVVDEDGNALGVMSSYEALQIATARGLDLVEISATSKPPVCKIVDYGKFNYERQKKEKLAKKNQHVMHIKEIRFNPNTDTHDIDFKTKHLRQFLIEGHKVKAYVMFKGRMITHPEIGRKLMSDIVEKLNDIAKLESPPRMEGKQLFAYFLPDKNKIQLHKDNVSKEKKQLAKTAEKKETSNPITEENKTIEKEDA